MATLTRFLLLQNLQALHGYPKEEVEQKSSNVGLFQNIPQMVFSNDGSMGQVDDPIKNIGQPRDFDTFVNGDTGIRIRPRQGRNEQPNMNGMVLQSQGNAPRRIRLHVDRQFASAAKDGSFASAPEDHNSKTTISRVSSFFIELTYLTQLFVTTCIELRLLCSCFCRSGMVQKTMLPMRAAAAALAMLMKQRRNLLSHVMLQVQNSSQKRAEGGITVQRFRLTVACGLVFLQFLQLCWFQ